jgi:hypothetical protein
MKKLLSIGAILLALGLTGCNQALEKMFPEEIGPGSINVTVRAGSSNAGQLVYVELQRQSGSDPWEYVPNSQRQVTLGAAGEGTTPYENVPLGNYYVCVSYDDDADGLVDYWNYYDGFYWTDEYSNYPFEVTADGTLYVTSSWWWTAP